MSLKRPGQGTVWEQRVPIPEGVDLYDNFTRTSAVPSDDRSRWWSDDLNSDSLPDVAVIYENNNKIEIFYQGTDGSFDNHSRRSSLVGNMTSIALGDMNDGLADDLVVCFHSSRDRISSRSSPKNSTSTKLVDPITTYRNPDSVGVGDFDAGWLERCRWWCHPAPPRAISASIVTLSILLRDDISRSRNGSKATLSCIDDYDANGRTGCVDRGPFHRYVIDLVQQ